MMRKYPVRFGERSRETRSPRDEKVRSAPTRLSPILANIYLHELDQFMKELKKQFDQGKERKKYPPYHRPTERIRLLRKKADQLQEKEETASQLQTIQEEIRQIDHRRKQLAIRRPF